MPKGTDFCFSMYSDGINTYTKNELSTLSINLHI